MELNKIFKDGLWSTEINVRDFAVSYTHLYVYKRQIIPVTSKPVNMHLQRLPIILLFTSVVFINVAFKLLLYLCLLYTSQTGI